MIGELCETCPLLELCDSPGFETAKEVADLIAEKLAKGEQWNHECLTIESEDTDTTYIIDGRFITYDEYLVAEDCATDIDAEMCKLYGREGRV